MNQEYYEIVMDGTIIDTTRLGGIAFLMFRTAKLINKNTKLIKRFDDADDNILHSPKQYNIEDGSWDDLK